MTRWNTRKPICGNETRCRGFGSGPAGGWTHETPPGGGFAGNAALSRMVCAVSSQLRHECQGFDEIIKASDDDFITSGLKVSSLIRLGLIATIPRSAILGELGAISAGRLEKLRRQLAAHIRVTQQ